MSSEPSTYNELAQGIIRDYLRSAVIIDDHWPEPEYASADQEESDAASEEDDRELEEDDDGSVPPDPGALSSLTAGNKDDEELLSGLHRSLVESGLLACGIRYTQQERDKAIRLAQNADIVVLDWHLVGDDGAEALQILENLRSNEARRQELRFVCVFTGHGRIAEVRNEIEKRLGIDERQSVNPSERSDANIRSGNLVIAIRNKKGLEEQDPDNTAGPNELLSHALSGLAENYDGLVQLTMLELTQHHRRHLPAILERLDRSLDAAVLLEAGDEKSPVGSGGSFLAILIDEWRAHLEQSNEQFRALGLASLESFRRPLAEKLGMVASEDLEETLTKAGFPSQQKAKTVAAQDQREDLQRWLMSGFLRSAEFPRGIQEKTSIFAERGIALAAMGLETGTLDKSLLSLDALFHQQFEKPLALTQGTLVAVESGSEPPVYLLCATPSCDAERPKEKIENLFTFLRTKKVDTSGIFQDPVKRPVYCVLRLDSGLLCLEICIKEKVILEIADRFFSAEGIIQGMQPLDPRETPESINLESVAQLRNEHALAVTAASAADGSRVGVNRVERIRSRLSRGD